MEVCVVKVTVTALGHASVLFDLGGSCVLADPVLSDRIGVSVGSWTLGAKRLRPPALRAHELSSLSVVLLSHSHMDHTDIPTLRALPKEAVAVVQRGNADLVRHFHKRHALRWGEVLDIALPSIGVLRIRAIPSKHWGARAVFDRWRMWGGYLLECLDLRSPHFPDRPLSLLFSGDTALTDVYAKLRAERGAGVDLACMPIGAYDPWIFHHCSPEQAWKMAIHDLEAVALMPVHYDTFRLSNEPVGEPMERLQQIALKDGGLERIVGGVLGQPYVVFDVASRSLG